ncbi:geranyltranstransferase (plasmid) [Legionella adelaidensis]|uniref:Geranyltranstransferase n=1 Tax=Legionella adelaidensis TaxID=45056 RepID=A0A0W0R368_9GAMM|nr:polyprenyl synthetase family protein [Legionella adelaidensis]KTC65495.1 geranyltranstransferase [Legionella adelaidensis]VEH84684.1 geranyltranstransferase [Legionella adelaidensis]
MSHDPFSYYLDRQEKVLLNLIDEIYVPAQRIKEAINYALFPGGKRIRPLLVYLCGEILEVPIDILDNIAAAIELTHCYSLVHDDLPSMDNDDFRRGKPSCHRYFDEATAILVGDGMQAMAIECLLAKLTAFLPAGKVIHLAQILLSASGFAGMVSGQSLDLTELVKPSISESTLCDIHMLKTGKLIIACIKMVIAAARVDEEKESALNSFAEHLGLLFQMEDDYLDRYCSISLGKDRASDLVNQKLTFASIYSQKELRQLIKNLHQDTIATLDAFGNQADNLLHLLHTLYSRIDS